MLQKSTGKSPQTRISCSPDMLPTLSSSRTLISLSIVVTQNSQFSISSKRHSKKIIAQNQPTMNNRRQNHGCQDDGCLSGLSPIVIKNGCNHQVKHNNTINKSCAFYDFYSSCQHNKLSRINPQNFVKIHHFNFIPTPCYLTSTATRLPLIKKNCPP